MELGNTVLIQILSYKTTFSWMSKQDICGSLGSLQCVDISFHVLNGLLGQFIKQ